MACGGLPQVSGRLVGAAAAGTDGSYRRRGPVVAPDLVVPPHPTPPDHRKTGDGRRAGTSSPSHHKKMRLNRSNKGNTAGGSDAAPFGSETAARPVAW